MIENVANSYENDRKCCKFFRKMMKNDRRTAKRFKDRYGHFGAGSVHTRQASDAEVRRHVEKAKKKNTK